VGITSVKIIITIFLPRERTCAALRMISFTISLISLHKSDRWGPFWYLGRGGEGRGMVKRVVLEMLWRLETGQEGIHQE
jgi:hypothetical protein